MNAKRKNIVKIAVILLVGLLLGWLIFGGGNATNEVSHDHTEDSAEQIWTCSMHPQIRQNEPGDCPICGMDLIPLATTGAGGDMASYQMSENAMKLANVQTMIVGKGDATREVRLNGKVQIDERNSYSQSTHIPGRIERLSINFTGERVQRGQTLATVYSPEMVTAQEELLQAASIRESQPELFEAAKQKLRNWRIGESQVNQIISSGRTLQNFPITADVSGIVTEKLVDLGDYVERGMPIYEISDLSKVWVLFDLYEGQIAVVNEGDKVEFTINSFPGETFEGTITFVDPLLDSQSRVSTARVEVENKNGRLKPGMFASGIVKNSLGKADVQALVIPKSAVLWTGKRSIVYVKNNVEGGGGFQLREVTLGPSLGDSYVVQEGLEPGEEIVSSGAFTVDAAVQLSGRPSMMNPAAVEEKQNSNNTLTVSISNAAKKELMQVTSAYLDLKEALVKDDMARAKERARALGDVVKNVDPSVLDQDGKIVWDSYKEELATAAKNISTGKDIAGMRRGFISLSKTMIGLVKTFQLNSETLYVLHCPMANDDQGANWLSRSPEIENPFFGASMLRCGEVTQTLE
ncbi:efflux RND transporter periplasmic adaptor subunit [Antarcticibacterium flavum]|uniref:Efflux RND transporter periplasmic adaptor subunit n=1 Tax=Antarcticibacterium flavum TaxID=2058175 RepID=A0A5B7X672_9FLAO|nr:MULTISPECIES: efflux RND transporter periplasmic adaptor subunit [Antarcticibacterium]MCM4158497.1 efflux RND transporter periplasmic adaptor subunit [Antarcticibacterium sp. W02-3]QCY70248.1 efflux RND transporter periplasmic adaptor subunit [Antarcticibacterium flavum]